MTGYTKNFKAYNPPVTALVSVNESGKDDTPARRNQNVLDESEILIRRKLRKIGNSLNPMFLKITEIWGLFESLITGIN